MHGVEKYFLRLLGTAISDAIFHVPVFILWFLMVFYVDYTLVHGVSNSCF